MGSVFPPLILFTPLFAGLGSYLGLAVGGIGGLIGGAFTDASLVVMGVLVGGGLAIGVGIVVTILYLCGIGVFGMFLVLLRIIGVGVG